MKSETKNSILIIGGGGESRTRVLKCFPTKRYKLSRNFSFSQSVSAIDRLTTIHFQLISSDRQKPSQTSPSKGLHLDGGPRAYLRETPTQAAIAA